MPLYSNENKGTRSLDFQKGDAQKYIVGIKDMMLMQTKEIIKKQKAPKIIIGVSLILTPKCHPVIHDRKSGAR